MTSTEVYAITVPEDGPARMQLRYEDGSTGKIIEYDDGSARHRAREGEEAFALPMLEQLVYGAVFVLQHRLLLPIDDVPLADVRHAGGDALFRDPAPGQRVDAVELEILEWSLVDGLSARFGFGAATGHLLQIDVFDAPSGARATIHLSDYRSQDDFVFPATIDVVGDGMNYRDTLTEWQLTP